MNRLTNADYYEQSVFPGNAQHTEDFDVTLSYDANGNIGSLERHGLYGTSSFGKIDDLSYLYTGNQLRRVTDNSSVAQTAGVTQFRDGANVGDDYGYDGNGNLDSDENKGIQSIAYNHFNKPTKITYTDGREIRYYYSADGTKLRQTVHTYRTVDEITPTLVISKRSDYLGAIHYEDADGDGTTSSLEITFIQHEEGRYRPNGSKMIYEYNLTDHLGNTRITFGDSDTDGLVEILQENHYYPFGMAMTMSSTLAAAPPNNYLYNGKELQDELDLGWYDYGARMYDASIGRWNGVDALASSYLRSTPYNYVQNNPISRIDPDGNSCVGCGKNGEDLTPHEIDGMPSYIGTNSNGEPDPDESDAYNRPDEWIYGRRTWFGRLRNFGRKLLGNGEQLAWSGLGYANALGSDLILGAGRIDVNDSRVPEHLKQSYLAGQRGGDATAIVIGSFEIGEGLTLEVASLGVATPIAVPLIAHGATVTGVASAHLANDRLNASSKRSGGYRSKTRGANKNDRKMVDDAANEVGIQDRRAFGKFVEEEKKALNRGGSENFSYEELLELGEYFKAEGRH